MTPTPEITTAVKPTVPPGAAEAALVAFERGMGYSHRERVRWALAAALPHLLPGMYVTRHGGCLEVWRENPEHPDRPHALDARELAEALALILPDRTQEG